MSIGLDHDWAMVSSGANDDLDLRNIQNIYLTISKYKTGADGAVAFDELEGALVSGYQNTFQSGDIISSFNVDNIPFSPNGDGYNDTVTFDFKLNVKARVSVKIYSLSGFPIKEFPSAEYSPGSEVPITWDGLDLKNKVVKNGMYFFQLLAVSLDGKKQSVNYGLAVVK